MQTRLILLTTLLFSFAGCANDERAYAVAKQMEDLDRRIDEAIKPIAMSLIRRNLTAATAEALETSRTTALQRLRDIKKDFQSAIQRPPASVDFGGEMYDAFAKYIDDEIRLLESDLKNVTDMMFALVANPSNQAAQRQLGADLDAFLAASTQAVKPVAAVQQKFAAAHNIRLTEFRMR